MSDIVERLRLQEHRGRYTIGGGTITADGKGTSWGGEKIMEYRNPDGPEAANEIERLREALRRIGLPEDTERNLMPLEMRMIAREALSLHKGEPM